MFDYSLLKKIFVILCAVIILNACSHVLHPAENICIVNRAAFDIGSETTKMKIGRVDKCIQKNLEIIYKNEIKVSYAGNISHGVFNEAIKEEGITALQKLKNEAISYRAVEFAGVATESFRKAANSADFLQKIKNKTGITIEIISQEKEALEGYMAAVASFPVNIENIVVWDIGGSSMQIVCRQEDKKYLIYQGKVASVSFKDIVLAQIKYQKLDSRTSPNPIGVLNLDKAILLAMSAAADVPDEIRHIIQKPEIVIVGIGGVHNESVKKQLNSTNVYTTEEIVNVLNKRIKLSDAEIGGQYVQTEVTNLIMVLGFMKKLGIKEVITINVNLADGVLIDQAFW
jgi:exopolyphosphatase / guanosine-5'-triphosphate,3'-diphosphate pyrophosphatase